MQNADVTLVKVESISGALRGEEIHAARRQMLVAGIRIDLSINAARPRVPKLIVITINAQLQKAGLPADTILEAAAGQGSSTSEGGAEGSSSGILPVISGAVKGPVFLVIAFCSYQWYSKTKRERMIRNV